MHGSRPRIINIVIRHDETGIARAPWAFNMFYTKGCAAQKERIGKAKKATMELENAHMASHYIRSRIMDFKQGNMIKVD